jgi:3-oxoadipate enol-lactonase
MASFKFKEYTINYDIKGIGKPIILLNGIMMSTPSWEPFVKNLSYQNQLIRFDFLDQGMSSRLLESYTLDLQVEVLKALIEELKLSKVNLVGISYGASVALSFAVKYQRYLERIIIANGTGYTHPWLKDIGHAWNLAAESKNGEAYYFTTIPTIYSPYFYQSRLDWMKHREKILTPLFNNEGFTKAMIRLTKSADDFDVMDRLHTIEVPVLIIGADQDYLTPFPEQIKLHEGIKGSQLVKLVNCGHASMYEKPFLFTSLVLGFINTLESSYSI